MKKKKISKTEKKRLTLEKFCNWYVQKYTPHWDIKVSLKNK